MIEGRYGPLPPFDIVRTIRPGPLVRKYQIPWRIQIHPFRRNRTTFLYYPQNIEPRLAAANEPNGYLLYALIHDAIHPYQMEPLRRAYAKCYRFLPRPIAIIRGVLTHDEWLEGAAQLAMWSVAADLLAQPKAIAEVERHVYEDVGYRARLASYTNRTLALDLLSLAAAGLITKPTIAAAGLPFALPKRIGEEIDERAALVGERFDDPRSANHREV